MCVIFWALYLCWLFSIQRPFRCAKRYKHIFTCVIHTHTHPLAYAIAKFFFELQLCSSDRHQCVCVQFCSLNIHMFDAELFVSIHSIRSILSLSHQYTIDFVDRLIIEALCSLLFSCFNFLSVWCILVFAQYVVRFVLIVRTEWQQFRPIHVYTIISDCFGCIRLEHITFTIITLITSGR